MTGEKQRDRGGQGAFVEEVCVSGIERRPENKGRNDTQDVFPQDLPQALRAGEKEHAADHHEDGNGPADEAVIQVKGLPRGRINIGVRPMLRGKVECNDGKGRRDAQHVIAGDALRSGLFHG